MIELKRILVPTDFSEPSAAAVKYAKEFAEAFGASLHVLHVLEDPLVFAPMSEGYATPPNFYEELEKNARDRLAAVVSAAELPTPQTRVTLTKGSPFVEIVRYAKSEDIDLIVMGTHGRGPMAHMLMGSVAEKVVRKAPCPVLTVRHPEHEFVMP